MKVRALWRHPVKGIGREPLERTELAADRPMPGDRAWAIRHEAAPVAHGWRPRGEFTVVASGPDLAAVTVRSEGNEVTLSHPGRPTMRFVLPEDGGKMIRWMTPLWPDNRPAPAALVRGPAATGMADNGIASLSILTEASLAALSEAAGASLDPGRFRGNVLLGGTEPWEEFDWVGKRLRLGGAVLEVLEPIERCRATEANPATGRRDVQTLAVLRDRFGHRDFGIYARVVSAGAVAVGDEAGIEA